MKRPKLKYDWPSFFQDGSKLHLRGGNHWYFEKDEDGLYVVSFILLSEFFNLPDPPEGCEVGTVFVKGKK